MLRQAIDLTEPLWRKHPEIRFVSELPAMGAVRANSSDLQRVFTNLIINAIQAMPEGGTLRLEAETRDGSVVVRVSDTGVGIAPENQKRIFMPYFTTKAQGTGLGLSTAQRTVLAQGGKIEFTSRPGEGTTFTVTLPCMVQAQPQPEQVAA